MVAHGCTGKGNDQVRFGVGIRNLAPNLTCLAPVRDLALTRDKTSTSPNGGSADRRDQQVAVLHRPERLGPRSRDRFPGGHLERPDRAPVLHTQDPAVPREADEVVITFDRGRPVKIGPDVTMLQAIEIMNARQARTASAGSMSWRTGWSASKPRDLREPGPMR